jgi:NitT/TauT family transport system substrate-binding protein
MKRRSFLSGMSAMGLSLFAPACKHGATPLRIASHVWAGYEFMFLAQREGWISPQDITLTETRSATESMQLLADGKADGVALTLDEMLRAREQGTPLMAVLIFDISMGADALLAKPGIDTLAQLKGKRIGYEQSAVGALMLHEALKAAALTPADVERVPATPDQHLQLWHSEKVDALITFEPTASQLQAENAHILFDSSKIPNEIFDMMVVHEDVFQARRQDVCGVARQWFRALDYMRQSPDDASSRIAKRLGVSAQEYKAMLGGISTPTLQENLRLLSGSEPGIVAPANNLVQVMLKEGQLKRSVDIHRALDGNIGGCIAK